MQPLSAVIAELPGYRSFQVFEINCHACHADYRCAADLAIEAQCPRCGTASLVADFNVLGILVSRQCPPAKVVSESWLLRKWR